MQPDNILLTCRYLVYIKLMCGKLIFVGVADTEDSADRFVQDFCLDEFKNILSEQKIEVQDVEYEYDLMYMTPECLTLIP